MSMDVPFNVVATYVGRKPGGSGKRNGESFDWGEKPQFAVPQPDGSVSLWDLRGDDFDKVAPPGFDHSGLTAGDRVQLAGSAFIPGRGSDSTGFVRLSAANPVDAKTGEIRAA